MSDTRYSKRGIAGLMPMFSIDRSMKPDTSPLLSNWRPKVKNGTGLGRILSGIITGFKGKDIQMGTDIDHKQ
jgi:hypothetical protein